jgi:hypothetical protein
MPQPPILKTMDEMLAKLGDAVRINRESGIAVREYTDAVRALAQVCEDEDIKNEYLTRLEEVSGKKGFVDAIRSVLRPGAAYKTVHIKELIVLLRKMDFTGYTNPMASIHTTLRRMKIAGEIEELQNDKGEKLYRLAPGSKGPSQSEIDEQEKIKKTLTDREQFQVSNIRRDATTQKPIPPYVEESLRRNRLK